MTERRIRYWRHVNRPAVIDWAYADSAGTVEYFTGSPYWAEVTVTPIVSGDVIERTARALHAWDVEGGPCEGPWESLTPEQHEVWLSGARALADAGLLAVKTTKSSSGKSHTAPGRSTIRSNPTTKANDEKSE